MVEPILDYPRDPAEIYRRSFAAIRAEARLDDFPPGIDEMAVRLIHACGMTDIVADLAFTADAVARGRMALDAGAPILVDSRMLAEGIIRRRLPADNAVLCPLSETTAEEAARLGTTRSAAAVDRWAARIGGAVVAFGNAPTALFRMLELIDGGAPRPAVVLAFTVGFVGAAESKEVLIEDPRGCAYVTLRGRRGGSALAAAAVNALSRSGTS